MPESQNIQIPLSLFMKLVTFFNCLSFGKYKFPTLYDFDGMYAELQAKLDRINLRTAYTKTLLAKDDTQKIQSYDNYQKLKNRR
ncbi:MAG: hypothetical protein FWH57_12065 [Oscillospiraceae bacterium]|nr:hypothetical protein [Oscillospiraceae bacterium]